MNRLFLVTLAVLGLGATHRATAAEAFGHDAFGRVLRDCVKDARVDYRALKARPADLQAYLDDIAAIRPDAFALWTREERLALLINLYNAQTLRLIADHYPVASIRKIGLLPGSAWRRKIVRFGVRVISLDDLEHSIIRKEYAEPRVHFALVCAAKGCPPLRDEPFLASRLDEQLDDQARRFLADSEKNRFEPETGTLWLSPIFDWFAGDFTAGGRSIAEFVRPFFPEDVRRALERIEEPKVRFTEYDWSLNDHRSP